MAIPQRLSEYLSASATGYGIVEHRHSGCSAGSARVAKVPAHQLAKAVVLEDDSGCVLALVPADRSVQVGRLGQLLHRGQLHLADEVRCAAIFAGCEAGAVPSLGMPWGVETVVDDTLEQCDPVYLECGDHERLLLLTHAQFHELVRSAPHGAFSGPRVH
ncbi:MAG: YbaK/EbsC family protein [Burkholderiales bacterium]|nr:YbaK/EbsC family protein [Burkholderiales bacterium]